MQHNNLKGSLILGTASLIWGLAFVAQSAAAEVPSFLVNSLRSFISVVFLWVLYRIQNRKTHAPVFPKDPVKRKTVLRGSILCGVLLTVAINFQQFGITLYPAGKDIAVEAHAGFLTALYVVLVPVFSLFLGKKISPVVWGAVLIAVVGFYLLCFRHGIDGVYLGDLLCFICAIAFSWHILTVDRVVGDIGGVRLSMLQFAVCGILSGILSLCFEHDTVDWSVVWQAALPIVYLGIMSSGVAYTLQIVGQQYAEPAVASLAMSPESVFAALGGFVAGLLHITEKRTLSLGEGIGCALVFAAIIFAQIPDLLHRRSDRNKTEEK